MFFLIFLICLEVSGNVAATVEKFQFLLRNEGIVDKGEIYKHLTIKGSLSARLPLIFNHLPYLSHSCQRERIFIELRQYIPILARRSRCFPRSLETLRAVLELFAYAYNRFHLAAFNFKLHFLNREFSLGLVGFCNILVWIHPLCIRT